MRWIPGPRFTRLPAPLRLPAGLALGLAQAYLIVVAVLFVFQRSLIYPSWSLPGEFVAPLGVSRVSVPTADGQTLLGYWRRPSAGKPILVSFHGNASSPLFHAERFMGSPWSDDGWGFLAIAYRGYPGSTGTPSEAGLARDGKAALDYARGEDPAAPIVLHGHSLGAAVAIGLAAREPVRALYLEAPFLSLHATAAARFPWLPTFLISDAYPSEARAPGITVPVHIVHGALDPVVPQDQGARLAKLFPNATFHAVADRDHASVFGSRDDEVERALLAAATRPRGEAAARPQDDPRPRAQ